MKSRNETHGQNKTNVLLAPLVCNSTTPHTRHIRPEHSSLVLPCPRRPRVATILREEHRHAQHFQIRDHQIISRRSVRGVAAPLKSIEPVKVNRLALVPSADQVFSQLLIPAIDYVGEVSDWNGAVLSGGSVCLHVPGCCFQVWGEVDLAVFAGFSRGA